MKYVPLDHAAFFITVLTLLSSQIAKQAQKFGNRLFANGETSKPKPAPQAVYETSKVSPVQDSTGKALPSPAKVSSSIPLRGGDDAQGDSLLSGVAEARSLLKSAERRIHDVPVAEIERLKLELAKSEVRRKRGVHEGLNV